MEAHAEEQTNNEQAMQMDDESEQSVESEASTIEQVVNQVVNDATSAPEVVEKVSKKDPEEKKKIMKIDAKHVKEVAETEEEQESDVEESEDSEEEDDEDNVESEEEQIEQTDVKKSIKLSEKQMKGIAEAALKSKAKEANIAEKIKKASKGKTIKEVTVKRKRSAEEDIKPSSSKKQKTESGVVKKSARRVVKVVEPLKERSAKIKAEKANKEIAKSGTRAKSGAKTKTDIQSRAKASKGVPDVKSASKKPRKSNKLSSKDAHIKYRTRLGLIPQKEFGILDGAWISIYEPSIKNRKKFEKGFFPLKWTQILRDVAEENDAHIIGCLPHYAKTIQGTDLKAYLVKPEIVDRDKEEDYHDAGYKNVQGLRVYVGKRVGASNEDESQFAMLADDHKADELWYAIKDVLDGDSEDEE